MKGKKMSVLGREIMTEILPEEIPIGIDITEEEGGVGAIAGVEVEVGAKRDCGTGIETGAEAGAEHEAEKGIWESQNMIWIEQIH